MEKYITQLLNKPQEEIRIELKNLLSQLKDIDKFFKEFPNHEKDFTNWLLANNKI
jgi:hypothetical protein